MRAVAFCATCGLGLAWVGPDNDPARPLCGDCFERERIRKLVEERREQEPLTEGPIGIAGFLSGRYR